MSKRESADLKMSSSALEASVAACGKSGSSSNCCVCVERGKAMSEAPGVEFVVNSTLIQSFGVRFPEERGTDEDLAAE